MDIADDLSGKTADISNYTEDISNEDTVGRSDGKTASCTNKGEVNGDISVGGIAGAMAKENALDPEGDLETSGTRSIDFVYKTKTVVRDSFNTGAVRGKRDSIGGITGDMATGAVISCRDTGNISSESGSYVGGIAGKSTSGIYSCSAMCSLYGKDYVGGIAGMGKDIYECSAFVRPVQFNEFCGSISGYADGELINNRFVENGFGGNDGVSFDGRAYPLSYEQMMAEDVPDDFGNMKLVFAVCTDDGSITSITAIEEVPYGGSITDDIIPDVPEKSGYFGKWEDFDRENIVFSETIKAKYSRLLTSTGSDERDANGLMRVIAEGSFTDDDKVMISGSDGAYHIVLPVETGGTLVRYLPDGDAEKTELYSGGQLLYTETDGRYLVFTAPAPEIDITERQKPSMMPYFAAGGVAAAALLITVISVHAARKKRKKR